MPEPATTPLRTTAAVDEPRAVARRRRRSPRVGRRRCPSGSSPTRDRRAARRRRATGSSDADRHARAAPSPRPDERLCRSRRRRRARARSRAPASTPRDLDLVLVATIDADDRAARTRRRWSPSALGASRAGAIDVGAACTGFLSALALAAAADRVRPRRVVLVIGAELMSRAHSTPTTARTAALFGDGAGAVVVPRRRAGPDRAVVLRSDGARRRPRSSPTASEGADPRCTATTPSAHAVARMARGRRSEALAAAGLDARRDRPLRLPPGQRADPARGRRAARARPRARRRLDRQLRQHLRRVASRSRSPSRARRAPAPRRARAARRLRRRPHLGRRP